MIIMDEQQMIQLLNQIPLDVLQNYVAQRAQQEQQAAQGASEEAYSAEAMPAEAQPMMSRGGRLRTFNPYIDMYSCGGRLRGTLGATRGGHR
jgi:hypothetical protein